MKEVTWIEAVIAATIFGIALYVMVVNPSGIREQCVNGYVYVTDATGYSRQKINQDGKPETCQPRRY